MGWLLFCSTEMELRATTHYINVLLLSSTYSYMPLSLIFQIKKFTVTKIEERKGKC